MKTKGQKKKGDELGASQRYSTAGAQINFFIGSKTSQIFFFSHTLFTTIKFPANKFMKIEFFFANQVFALFYRLELTQQLKAAVRRNETLESELRETKKRLRLAEAAGEAANRDTTSAQQSLESLKFRLQEMEAIVALERRKCQEKEAKKAQLETRDL